MKLKVHVYLTTRSDPVDDLDTVQGFDELELWKENSKSHAVKIFEYDELGGRMIEDLMNFTIHECYALIAYPPGKVHEASDEVGGMLLQFLKGNSQKLRWDLKETGLSSEWDPKEMSLDSVSAEESIEELRGLVEKYRFVDSSRLWENFTYGLVSDKDLKDGEYEIDLEIVVESDKELSTES